MNAPVFEQIAIFVSAHPNGVGRSDVAAQFSIKKNTALYHLEKCVERGLLRKVYTWISDRSRGWVYYPSDKPERAYEVSNVFAREEIYPADNQHTARDFMDLYHGELR